MSDDLTRLTGAALGELLTKGEISSVEVTKAHLDRITAVDGDVHAFLHINEYALDTAEGVEAFLEKRKPRFELAEDA